MAKNSRLLELEKQAADLDRQIVRLDRTEHYKKLQAELNRQISELKSGSIKPASAIPQPKKQFNLIPLVVLLVLSMLALSIYLEPSITGFITGVGNITLGDNTTNVTLAVNDTINTSVDNLAITINESLEIVKSLDILTNISLKNISSINMPVKNFSLVNESVNLSSAIFRERHLLKLIDSRGRSGRFTLRDRKRSRDITGLDKGVYDLEIIPETGPVKQVLLNNVVIDSNISLGIDDVPEDNRWIEVYAIDPSNINFTDGSLKAVAKGSVLYKCKDWNFSTQACGSPCEGFDCPNRWIKVQDLIPGKEYTVQLSPDDPAFAEANVSALHDTFVYEASPNGNFDENTNALALGRAGGNRAYVYLRFNISGITGTILNSTLRLYLDTGTGGVFDFELYQVPDDSWDETTITWNNQPSTGSFIQNVSPTAVGVWYGWDVSDYVRSTSLNSSDDSVSFVLKSDSAAAANYGLFEDHENTRSTGNLPQLLVTSNRVPNATSVSNVPDKQFEGRDIQFNAVWDELDAGQNVSIFICKDSTCSNCNLTSQSDCWCNSSDNVSSCNYTVQASDGLSNDYWLGVCDDYVCDQSPLAGGGWFKALTPKSFFVQRGEVSGTGDLIDAIQDVNPDYSFILFRAITDDSTPDDWQFTPNITNSSEVSFSRYDGAGITSTIRYQVVESNNLSVQRGEEVLTSGTSSKNVPIQQVDLTESFIIVYGRCADELNSDSHAGFFTANFTNSTNILLIRGNEGKCAASVSWQVVEWEDSFVQSGQSVIADSSDSITASISSVDLAQSFLVFGSASVGTDPGMDSNLILGNITSPTQLFFTHEPGSTYVSSEKIIDWFVVTLPTISVQKGLTSLSSDTTESITSVNTSRAFHLSSGWNTGGGQSYANHLYTINLSDPTTLQFDKQTGSQTQNIFWQVIESLPIIINDSSPPNVTDLATDDILYGINYSALIFASVVDDYGIGSVKANVTLPNDTIITVDLSFNSIFSRYEGYFNDTFELGVHNVTIIATDLYDNVNDSEKTSFRIVQPNLSALKYDSEDPVQVGQSFTYFINNSAELTEGIVQLVFDDISLLGNSTDFKDSPQMIESSDGTLLIVYNKNNIPSQDNGNHDIWLYRSTDFGNNWSHTRITDEVGHDIFPNIFEDDDGDILVAYTHMDSSGSIWAAGDVWIVKSGDDGVTWSEPTAAITTPGFVEREPVLEQDSQGVYYLCYEGGDGEIYIHNSSDWQSWSSGIQMTNNSYGDVDLEIHIINDTFFFAWAPFDLSDSNVSDQDIFFAKTTDPMVFNVLDDNLVKLTDNILREYETSISSDTNDYIYIAWSGTTDVSDNFWSYEEQYNRSSNELFIAQSFDFGDSWDIRMVTDDNVSNGYPGVVQSGSEGFYYLASLVGNDATFAMDIGFGQRVYSPEDVINVSVVDDYPDDLIIQDIGQAGVLQDSIINWSFDVVYSGQVKTLSFTSLVNKSTPNGTLLNNTFNVTYYDSRGRLINSFIDSETTLVIDTIPPDVINVSPQGIFVNQSSPVLLSANVSDNGIIGSVFANVSIPGVGYEFLELLLNSSSGLYESLFTNTSALGIYNFTIFADDTTGNLNVSEDGYFLSSNSPASMPASISCNNGSCTGNFNQSVAINCSGSSDPDNDSIIYHIEALYEPVVGNNRTVIADFESDNDSFIYQDDLYSTSQPVQAVGEREIDGNCSSGSCLNVELNLNSPVTGSMISGGWNRSFNITDDPIYIQVSFDYTLRLDDETETDENITLTFRNTSDNTIIYGPSLSGFTGTDFIDELLSGTIMVNMTVGKGLDYFDVGCLLSSVNSLNENGECWIDNLEILEINTTDPSPDWREIGSHDEFSFFNWDISGQRPQSDIDLRCRAIDNGSNIFSDYFTGGFNLTVESPPAPAKVVDISDIPDQSIIEAGVSFVEFFVLVSDINSVDQIDDSSVNASFSRPGEDLRYNNSCQLIADINSTTANYSCTVPIWYFDGAGSWNVNVSAKDTDNSQSDYNESFLLLETTAITLSPDFLSWDVLAPGETGRSSNNDPIIINNTGNDHVNLTLKSFDLLGNTTPEMIPAENFSINIIDSCGGILMFNDTVVNISGSSLPAGNLSDNQGQEYLYVCLEEVPMNITQQTYSSFYSWIVSVI